MKFHVNSGIVSFSRSGAVWQSTAALSGFRPPAVTRCTLRRSRASGNLLLDLTKSTMEGLKAMKLTVTTTILLLFAMISSSVSSPKATVVCPPEAALLEVGEFHGEDVSAETGEPWLGLHISDNGSTLLNYTITVTKVHDPLLDNGDQMTGKKISVDLPLEPIFLVNSDWLLQSGPVVTAFKGNDEPLRSASSQNLKLAGSDYEIKIIGENAKKCEHSSLPRNAKLVLTSGNASQVLYTLQDCGNDPTWALIWAGDLDKDGKLDLYVTVNQHYDVIERKLFLSSQTDEGQLVAEVAEFVTSGC